MIAAIEDAVNALRSPRSNATVISKGVYRLMWDLAKSDIYGVKRDISHAGLCMLHRRITGDDINA